MYCPECGHDAGDAKFCPECGADLAGLRSAFHKTAGRPTGGPGSQSSPGSQGAAGEQDRGGGGEQTAAVQTAAGRPAGRGFSPAVIWGGFGVVAVVVIVAVIMFSGGFGGKNPTPSASGSASATPVMGVTTGSYKSLVSAGNKFFDQGQTFINAGNFNQGVSYFEAAAMTYAAAWKKQATDPSVGTDFASALFYSGQLDAAIKQANLVLSKNPSFQKAYLTKGNAWAHKSLIANQQGDKKAVASDNVQAKQAYTKAVALDPSSQAGKMADQGLQSLPK